MDKRTLSSIPDFRNLGVWVRVAVLTQLLRVAVLLVGSDSFQAFGQRFFSQGPLLEVGLLATMTILAWTGPAIRRLSYGHSVALTCGISIGVVLGCQHGLTTLLGPAVDAAPPTFTAISTALTTAAILFYFNWHHHRQAPAWAESRLMALQSRIRPHFLFNSLNSVLALIRSEPRKAEAMLEDLADLFRALLAEPRTLVPLVDELTLARSYVTIEGIRMGDRLRVHWQCDATLDATPVPQLLLQPLLENAVRYGAEPLEQGANIHVSVSREGNYLLLTVRNPVPPAEGEVLAGNRMALANIAERLSLHFDAEAQLKTSVAKGEHTAQVRLPITSLVTR